MQHLCWTDPSMTMQRQQATGTWPNWTKPLQPVTWPDLFNPFNNSLYGTFRFTKAHHNSGAFFSPPAFFSDGCPYDSDRYFSQAQFPDHLCDRTIWWYVGTADGRFFCHPYAGPVSVYQRY